MNLRKFQDRSQMLFGRDDFIDQVVNRAQGPGVTFIRGKPGMGKSWTIEEVASRLEHQCKYSIGFHEIKGGEPSHLLYAVMDLYTRWLSDSQWIEQAQALWLRHKENLVPVVGEMFGTLIDKLSSGGVLTDQIGFNVRECFGILSSLQHGLQKGGLDLAPIEYEQALSLVNLVSYITGDHIVLFMDAWEKNENLSQEAKLIESIIKDQAHWRNAHVVVVYRNEEVLDSNVGVHASILAERLCRTSPIAVDLELPLMDLSSASEVSRLERYLNTEIPFTSYVDIQKILEWISGFPLVISFWLEYQNSTGITTEVDIEKYAVEAHKNLYAGLIDRIDALSPAYREVVAKIALMPEMSLHEWLCLKEIVLDGVDDATIPELQDNNVFTGGRYPTLGHDTRRMAVITNLSHKYKNWFVACYEKLVIAIASNIQGVDAENRIYFQILFGLRSWQNIKGTDETTQIVLTIVESILTGKGGVFFPNFDDFIRSAVRFNPGLIPLVSIVIFNRGNYFLFKGDFRQAIDEYNDLEQLPGAPSRQVLKALVNRAHAKIQSNFDPIPDYTKVLSSEDSFFDRPGLLINRGISYCEVGEFSKAISDFEAVLLLDIKTTDNISGAILNWIKVVEDSGDEKDVVELFNNLVSDERFASSVVGQIHYERACYFRALPAGVSSKLGYVHTSYFDDFNGAIAADGIDVEILAESLWARAAIYCEVGNRQEEMADYDRVIGLSGAPVNTVIKALNNRAIMRELRGDFIGAFNDCLEALSYPNIDKTFRSDLEKLCARCKFQADGNTILQF